MREGQFADMRVVAAEEIDHLICRDHPSPVFSPRKRRRPTPRTIAQSYRGPRYSTQAFWPLSMLKITCAQRSRSAR